MDTLDKKRHGILSRGPISSFPPSHPKQEEGGWLRLRGFCLLSTELSCSSLLVVLRTAKASAVGRMERGTNQITREGGSFFLLRESNSRLSHRCFAERKSEGKIERAKKCVDFKNTLYEHC